MLVPGKVYSPFSFIIDGSKIQPSPTYLLPLTTWNASTFAMSTSSFTSNFLQGTARIKLLHLSSSPLKNPRGTLLYQFYLYIPNCLLQCGLSTSGYLSTKLGPANPLTSPLHFDHVSQGCSASKISALPGCSHRLQVQLDDWPQSLVYLPSRITFRKNASI